MSNRLDFEKPIAQLEEKIKELQSIVDQTGVDLSSEIEMLSGKVANMKDEVYLHLSPWQKVKIARLNERPTTLEYIDRIMDSFIELHGDRLYSDDKAIVGGVGVMDGMPVTIIGHQKGKDTKDNIKRNFGMPHPEGYRKALRLMKQAEKFKRPIVTFIDTPGAFCGLGAEERGQGEAIATNLLEMSRLKTPVIAIVIGEGGSGGALALGVGNRIAMLEHSVYSVISPEGLSSILWKDASKAQDAAGVMKLTAQDLKELFVIDDIIAEPMGGAHNDVDFMAANIKDYVSKWLKELSAVSGEELSNQRYEKIRKMGVWA
ncbi:acetyl-CoA carboxylase carboxyltransferase subunit alpha [Peptoclostridium litorale DSM 5388]|uniref:Acetyl-coenzyme A carboxylase carboxyl transferase subunit alpha n=1 Tax=Peptoclostridium litorale DSM 5388 TaxID=1121324 RepID=A0A069RHG5_PEPLI|nr:acetyl-CoA carboxylase carboxyltransferase subunit alpha [Peptoclostridium litorale]KDR96218.1 acetyl-coenzyme A carboxylase carboxyl transferase subunit alpha [Peptoclostridium litorale DSM 5388]SIO13828.1 acetyl-CoA carboxylase carboxyltransferase subunit alpha [Peptoclostridium litorale DSM 5388]